MLSPYLLTRYAVAVAWSGTPKVYPRDEAIARRSSTLARFAPSLLGLDRFHLYLAQPIMKIFMILFMVAVGLLRYYTAIEYSFQKV